MEPFDAFVPQFRALESAGWKHDARHTLRFGRQKLRGQRIRHHRERELVHPVCLHHDPR